MTTRDVEATPSTELRASAKDLQRQAYELAREADQRDYETELHQVATTAQAAWEAAGALTARYDAEAEGTLTAERAADDRVTAARRHLTACQSAETVLEGEHAPPGVQTDAGLVTLKATRVLEVETAALAEARAIRGRADTALDTHQRNVAELQAARDRAAWAATHPGQAPHTSAVPLGIARMDDLDDGQRQLVQEIALTLVTGLSHGEPPDGKREQDPTKFQYVNIPGKGTVAIPPRIVP